MMLVKAMHLEHHNPTFHLFADTLPAKQTSTAPPIHGHGEGNTPGVLRPCRGFAACNGSIIAASVAEAIAATAER